MAPFLTSLPSSSSSSSLFASFSSHDEKGCLMRSSNVSFRYRSASSVARGGAVRSPGRRTQSPSKRQEHRFTPPTRIGGGASVRSPGRRKQSPPSERQERPPKPLAQRRLWKEGEFPAVSDTQADRLQRTPIKNLKKKMDDRKAAKAWVATVTEVFAERIRKHQWQEALENPKAVLCLESDSGIQKSTPA